MTSKGQQQAQDEALQAVRAFLFELFLREPEIDVLVAFHQAKEQFGGLVGMGKEFFGGIFEGVHREFQRPLVRASVMLQNQEHDLKSRTFEALQAHEPAGPEEIRRLSKAAQQLRHGQGKALEDALASAADVVPEELRDELLACWPKLRDSVRLPGEPFPVGALPGVAPDHAKA